MPIFNNKPNVLPLRFSNLDQLDKAYMPFFKNGGLFVPTQSRYIMGDEMLLVIELPESDDKIQAKGIVSWVTPKNASGHKKQGVGVEFSDANGIALRHRIDGLLSDRKNGDVPGYTL